VELRFLIAVARLPLAVFRHRPGGSGGEAAGRGGGTARGGAEARGKAGLQPTALSRSLHA
jgi:hypothetical protein